MQGLMPCLSNFKKIQWILSPVMSSEVRHWKLQLQITPLMPMIGMPVKSLSFWGTLKIQDSFLSSAKAPASGSAFWTSWCRQTIMFGYLREITARQGTKFQHQLIIKCPSSLRVDNYLCSSCLPTMKWMLMVLKTFRTSYLRWPCFNSAVNLSPRKQQKEARFLKHHSGPTTAAW